VDASVTDPLNETDAEIFAVLASVTSTFTVSVARLESFALEASDTVNFACLALPDSSTVEASLHWRVSMLQTILPVRVLASAAFKVILPVEVNLLRLTVDASDTDTLWRTGIVISTRAVCLE